MSVEARGYWTLVAAFLASRESPNTRSAYRRDLTVLAESLGIGADEAPDRVVIGVEENDDARSAAHGLAALSPDWWQAWRDGLEGTPASRRRRVAGARAFCRWWSRLFALPNPTAELSPPGGAASRRAPREVVALDASQVRHLCEVAAQQPGPEGAATHALIETLYGLGLRASEAAGLNLSDLHIDDPNDPFVIVHGKGSRRRAVAVPAVALSALTAYLGAGRRELRARDTHPRADQQRHRDVDAVFLTRRGRRIGRAGVWREVQRIATMAGVITESQRVFPHALRHSCGTHLIQAGVDIRYVQAHLGHASPVTTEIYTHVTAAHLREDFDHAHPRSRRDRAIVSPPEERSDE